MSGSGRLFRFWGDQLTLYQSKRFTVPAAPTQKLYCNGNHPFADSKGKCVRCGERIRPDPYADKPQHDLDANRRSHLKRTRVDG